MTLRNTRDYRDPIYKAWRQSVKKRDGYKCRWPNCKSKYRLHCHHIKTWASIPALRYNINNGITLCRKHHDYIKGREEGLEKFFYTILIGREVK